MKMGIDISDDIKREIARQCIDLSGQKHSTVVVRVFRDGAVLINYHENGTDGYSNCDRFWFEFPVFNYRDLPSGSDIEERGNRFYIIHDNGKLEKIAKNTLINELIDDLIERDAMNFNKIWNRFRVLANDWAIWVKEYCE